MYRGSWVKPFHCTAHSKDSQQRRGERLGGRVREADRAGLRAGLRRSQRLLLDASNKPSGCDLLVQLKSRHNSDAVSHATVAEAHTSNVSLSLLLVSLIPQGLDVKRHCYDSWFSALHTDVNITVVDYK